MGFTTTATTQDDQNVRPILEYYVTNSKMDRLKHKFEMAAPVTFTDEEVTGFKETFNEFDADGNGHVTTEELAEVFKRLGESVPGYKLRDMISEVDTDNNKTIEFNEFIEMMKKVRSSGGKVTSQFAAAVKKVEKIKKVEGTSEKSTAGTTHSFSEGEMLGFSDWINTTLADDPDLQSILPIDATNENALFAAVRDGILMCKLINSSASGTIDERAINKTKMNAFKCSENQTLVLNSAAAIGCYIVNIGPEDLMKGTGHLVLGLMWQIIRIGLFAKINLSACPGLFRLLEGDEELADLLALPPDMLLLRWMNYHLKQAGQNRRIKNFSGDISDSEAYIYVLKQIAPAEFGVTTEALSAPAGDERAEKMLQNADKLGCRKFVRPQDVTKGNAKLNLAFVANLFNQYPGLAPPDADEEGCPDFDLGDVEETREERTFRNWMNSLGVNPFVNQLYNDLTDGIVLLQLFDKVQPGIVDWVKKVNNPPFKKLGGNMKKIENLNYAVQLAQQLKFSVVGIEGKDIFDGIKTLTLAVVWQLMRAYTLTILQKLSGSSKRITDAQIISWANDKLSDGGKDTRIRGFKDPEISSGKPILDLLDAIKPGSIDYEFFSEDDHLANAKYAISMARKNGAAVYALPEDIVEVKPKMLLTLFACVMAQCFEKEGVPL